jgi:hypothetical protein
MYRACPAKHVILAGAALSDVSEGAHTRTSLAGLGFQWVKLVRVWGVTSRWNIYIYIYIYPSLAPESSSPRRTRQPDSYVYGHLETQTNVMCYHIQKRHSAVSTMIGLRLDSMVRGSIMGMAKAISLSPKTTTPTLRRQELPRDKADGNWGPVLTSICGTRWRSGWGTALQTGRSRDRFSMVSKFFIDIILPADIWPWGRLSL